MILDSWNTIISSLERFRDLKDDWDGEGTSAPDPSVIDLAIHQAELFKKENHRLPDEVSVGLNATIYFFFEHSPDWSVPYLEYECCEGRVEARQVNKEDYF